jgi:hypothetical protein
LSEAEFRPRGRPALDRGGVSPEGASNPRLRRSFARGASSPRSRRSFARGDVQPSSESEFHPRGRPALERSGVSMLRCRATRPRRSFARGVLGPAACWAIGVTWAMVVRGVVCRWWVRLRFYYYAKKWVFSWVIRGPLWLSLTVAHEPLQWYPLGTRRGWCLLIGLSSLLVVVPFRGGALADLRV